MKLAVTIVDRAVGHIGIAESNSLQLGSPKVGSPKVGSPKVGSSSQVGSSQVGSSQVGVTQVGFLQKTINAFPSYQQFFYGCLSAQI